MVNMLKMDSLKDSFQNCDKHFCIVGMPKCGTVSLEKYLKDRFPGKEARRVEQVWKESSVERVVKQRPPEEWHYVIILRDNIERIWSGYHYFDYVNQMSLEEYLNYDVTKSYRMGIANPIKQADYGHWLKVWSVVDPIVVTLEEVSKLPGFPHENKTAPRRHYPEMTESERILISSYLNKNGIVN
jgi:hypothetical protein